MKSRLFLLSLVIAFFNNSTLSEENNIQNNLYNKNFEKPRLHIVKKGDTLSSIAKRYSVKKEFIIKANNLINENYIYVGQNLKLVEDLFPEKNIQDHDYFHEIKKGENLTEIASKYNLKLSELIELNNIKNKDILIVGTKLKLKQEISPKEENPIIKTMDQLDIDKTREDKKYGPLLIRLEKTNPKKRKIFLEATRKSGKRLILQINCDKKEINVRGIGRKWKGWLPARESFEIKLLNDFCLDFD